MILLGALSRIVPRHGDEVTLRRASDGRTTRHRFIDVASLCAWIDVDAWTVALIPSNPTDDRGAWSVKALGDDEDSVVHHPAWWLDAEEVSR